MCCGYPRLLRLLGPVGAAASHPHAVLVDQVSAKVRSEEACRHRQGGTDGHVCAAGHETRLVTPHPPVVRRCEDGDVVDQCVGDAGLCLFRAEAVPFDDGHELHGSGYNGGHGCEQGEDGRVVGEDWEDRDRQLELKRFDCSDVSVAVSLAVTGLRTCRCDDARRGRRHRREVQGIEGACEGGEGYGEVDRRRVRGMAVFVNTSRPSTVGSSVGLLCSHCVVVCGCEE